MLLKINGSHDASKLCEFSQLQLHTLIRIWVICHANITRLQYAMIIKTFRVENLVAGGIGRVITPAAPDPRSNQLVHQLVRMSMCVSAHGSGPLEADSDRWRQ